MKNRFTMILGFLASIIAVPALSEIAGAEKSQSQYGGERSRTETVAGWPIIASALGVPTPTPTLEHWKAAPARQASAEMIGFAASPARAWPARIGSPIRIEYMRAAVASAAAANAISEKVVPGVTVGALRSIEFARGRARTAFTKIPDAQLADIVSKAIEQAEAIEPNDVLQSAEVVFLTTAKDGATADYSHTREGITVAFSGRPWFGQDSISGRKVEFRIQRNSGESRQKAANTAIVQQPKDLK